MTASGNAGLSSEDKTQRLPPTSHQVLGPFDPLSEPSKGGDLTRVAGRSGRAEGQLLYFHGRVLNRRAEPVRRVKLEIWQANSFVAGDPHHDNGRWLLSSNRPETIVMPIRDRVDGMVNDAKRMIFDIVLMNG